MCLVPDSDKLKAGHIGTASPDPESMIDNAKDVPKYPLAIGIYKYQPLSVVYLLFYFSVFGT